MIAWTKLAVDFADDSTLLSLPRGVRVLYIEGLLYSNRQGTDGYIPGHVLGV